MKNKFNFLVKNSTPFFFIIDYDVKNIEIIELNNNNNNNNNNVFFNVNGVTNYTECFNNNNNNNNMFFNNDFVFFKKTIDYSTYSNIFSNIKSEFFKGNSYLINLTFPTEINTNRSLSEIFTHSSAKYKLLYKDKFVVFSPETFIKIKNDTIYSFPMKGTIDASIPNAENIILSDEKELAEHITIVDLVRNDLSMVAKDVKVNRFRYIDYISTNNRNLLQVSSEITGKLPKNYRDNLYDIILKLLPASSICGAPKLESMKIIKENEIYNRGYYTGIAGYFDGKNLDSFVMIRFIEKENDKLYYKSGGGITYNSDPIKEYKEMGDKIYVPVHRDNKNTK